MRVEFDTHEREPLLEQDFELFESVEDCTAVLDYSTLGKSLYDCYQDGLPPDYPGMKEQKHYCANFVLVFETGSRPNTGFRQWAQDHRITNLRTGQIKLGNISDKTAFDKVKQCVKIVTIKLE